MSFKPRIDQTHGNGHPPEDEAYWWQNPDHKDEWVKIRPMWNKVRYDLQKKHTRMRRGTAELNEATYFPALYDYMIADWEIYEDVEGTIPLPCTLENKVGLWETDSDRGDAIWEESKRLAGHQEARQEAERKNFRPVRETSDRATPGLSRVSHEL